MDDQKELYRLWYEYLKRSENYKEFCEWWRKREPVKSLNINDSYKEYCESYRKGKGRPDLLPVPRKFKTGNCLHIPETFRNLLDVHMFPFEDWWTWKKRELLESRKKRELLESSSRDRGPVANLLKDYSGNLETSIDYCIESLRESNNREPSAIELKKDLLHHLGITSLFGCCFLRINLDYPPQKIKAAFAEYLKSKDVKEEYASFIDRDDFCKNHQLPTGKPRIDDLQKYLDVYDMWEEKVQNKKQGDPGGWDQIIQHFEPDWDINGDDRLSKLKVYQDYKLKAKNIVSNTEQGYFPGRY